MVDFLFCTTASGVKCPPLDIVGSDWWMQIPAISWWSNQSNQWIALGENLHRIFHDFPMKIMGLSCYFPRKPIHWICLPVASVICGIPPTSLRQCLVRKHSGGWMLGAVLFDDIRMCLRTAYALIDSSIFVHIFSCKGQCSLVKYIELQHHFGMFLMFVAGKLRAKQGQTWYTDVDSGIESTVMSHV